MFLSSQYLLSTEKYLILKIDNKRSKMQEEPEKDKNKNKLPRRNFLKKLSTTAMFAAPIINTFKLQAQEGPDSPWWWWTGHHHHHKHEDGPPAPPPPPPPTDQSGEW